MLVGMEGRRLITQIVITILVVFAFFKVFSPDQTLREKPSKTEFKMINPPNIITSDSLTDRMRSCLNIAFFEEPIKKDFILRYRKCVSKYVKDIKYDEFYMGRFGENKVFLPQREPYEAEKCIWLTVGIGGTANAEKLFKEKYSHCDLYGIEASSDQYSSFADYGTIIPYGVGVTNGSFELTIRKGTSYFKKEVQVLSMAELLDKYVGSRTVHYMTIDIEGFEYTILEELLRGKILADQNIAFCQIDAELHGQNKDKAADILHKFDTNASDYIPVFAKQFLVHEKVTWANINHEQCKKAFDLQMFL